MYFFLQDEHSVRTHNSNTAYASVTRILREASQILENGHYAAGHVRSVATRLEQTWKELATIFDERTTVLGMKYILKIKEIVIFYTEILSRKVVLWCFFMSETSENVHNATF